MSTICSHCTMLHWIDERTQGAGSTTEYSLFNPCCNRGDVSLPFMRPLPPLLYSLFYDTTTLAVISVPTFANTTQKVGCLVMLLWNLYPSEGLCTGTRMVVTHLGQCKLLPRISLASLEGELPFIWTWKQFPIKLSFAMIQRSRWKWEERQKYWRRIIVPVVEASLQYPQRLWRQ